MDEIEDPYSRIETLLDNAEPRIARVFAAAIARLRESLDLDAVAELIAAGRYEELLDQLRIIAEEVGSTVNVVFFDAGQNTAQFLRTADVARVVFDMTNTRAVAQMQESRLRLITEFTDGQRDVLRTVMADGIARGTGPVEQARAFREVVGLTERQASAVINYRRLLERAGRDDFSISEQRESLTRALRDGRSDASVENAIARRRPLKKTQIDSMVRRYHARYVKYRAEVIGRTEALRAVHQGSEEQYAQAIEAGKIDPDAITEYWNTAHDRRVRDSHAALDRQPKGEDGTWHAQHGNLRFPGDPRAPAIETVQCRCIVTRTIRRRPLDTLTEALADII